MRAGIVLAGGTARRMDGVDKALLDVGGTTMLDRVLEALRPHCDDLIVVGPERATAVADVRFTLEDDPGGGPVPGVAAGLGLVLDAEVVIVMAVDLPLLTSEHVGRLVQALKDDVEAAAAQDHRGKPNPLLAAYAADRLRSVVDGLGPGRPASQLLPAKVVTLDLGEAATLNVNDAADLARARDLFRRAL